MKLTGRPALAKIKLNTKATIKIEPCRIAETIKKSRTDVISSTIHECPSLNNPTLEQLEKRKINNIPININ